MIAALVVFAALAAFICARARAAGPALLFGVVAVVLFSTTPLGAGLPRAAAAIATFVGESADKLAGVNTEGSSS